MKDQSFQPTQWLSSAVDLSFCLTIVSVSNVLGGLSVSLLSFFQLTNSSVSPKLLVFCVNCVLSCVNILFLEASSLFIIKERILLGYCCLQYDEEEYESLDADSRVPPMINKQSSEEYESIKENVSITCYSHLTYLLEILI